MANYRIRRVKVDYTVFPEEYVSILKEFSESSQEKYTQGKLRLKTKIYTLKRLLKGVKTEFHMLIDNDGERSLSWKLVRHLHRNQYQMRLIHGSEEYNVNDLREYEFLQIEPYIDKFIAHIARAIKNEGTE